MPVYSHRAILFFLDSLLMTYAIAKHRTTLLGILLLHMYCSYPVMYTVPYFLYEYSVSLKGSILEYPATYGLSEVGYITRDDSKQDGHLQHSLMQSLSIRVGRNDVLRIYFNRVYFSATNYL
jgi:hypothetical protein